MASGGFHHYQITVVYPYHTRAIDIYNTANFKWDKSTTALGSYSCTTIEHKREVRLDLIDRMKKLSIPSGMILFTTQLDYD